ncbi:unnamed protein product [Owenia fusiformis]|uniref:DOP1-like C-terminal domain-containing protein n=1 Tax=Owenia fusiformis TaxID=6347 RepID=A0A8J1XJQ3_OWEFU|nr:unnamed protein product [Owenia fusiformis]
MSRQPFWIFRAKILSVKSCLRVFRANLSRVALDPSWAQSNGLNAQNNPAWLHLYLAACKLLDLALVLPADALPQFQLYRWAFTGEGQEIRRSNKKEKPGFIPHLTRIAKAINKKFEMKSNIPKREPGRPLLNMSSIRSLQELQPFFNALVKTNEKREHSYTPTSQSGAIRRPPKSKSLPDFGQYTGDPLLAEACTNSQQYIEHIIERDFIEMLPKN